MPQSIDARTEHLKLPVPMGTGNQKRSIHTSSQKAVAERIGLLTD